MPGTLFVVATPIGNLEDVSLRARRTLEEADLIAAEDTRRTARLLARYDIRTSVQSYHGHNEARQTPRLLARLERGQSVALVSDAGTPGIADPGARLVAAAHEAGVPVVPVPGPSAIAAAISASGFDADRYVFMGFPPASGAARQRWMTEVSGEPRTVVFFEAPHRIRKTLRALSELVNRPIMVARELTKFHESVVISPNIGAVLDQNPKGEFVIVLGTLRSEAVNIDKQKVYMLFYRLTNNMEFDREEALGVVARSFGIDEREAAKLVKKGGIAAKRQRTAAP